MWKNVKTIFGSHLTQTPQLRRRINSAVPLEAVSKVLENLTKKRLRGGQKKTCVRLDANISPSVFQTKAQHFR